MSRETSPYVVGKHWLDKRRDGATPDTWQITTYKPGSRQVVYRSTKCRSLDDAIGVLHSYVDEQRARAPQPAEVASLAGGIINYWHEHGKKAERPDSIATSIRHFLAFLIQDELGAGVTVAQADHALFSRFIAWRMGPHDYEIEWGGKQFRHTSAGVKGETVHSDLARVGAAINRQIAFGRIPMAPKIPSVDKRFRSQPREFIYSIEGLGAVFAVAAMSAVTKDGETDVDGLALFRWLLLQLATACRPERALAFDPRVQYDDASGLIDLHPAGAPRTRKRNPVVPAIDEVRPFLRQWAKDGATPAKSRKRAWRTVRRVLGMPMEAVPKAIRYTVATEMRRLGTVPAIQIESILGHEAMKGVSARYAKYDPQYLGEAKAALSNIFRRVAIEAERFAAVHALSKTGNDATVLLDRNTEKAEDFCGSSDGAAYRTRTCDPRITNARKGLQTAEPCEVRPERSADT